MKAFRNLFSKSQANTETKVNVAIVTNFSSCALGQNLVKQLSMSGNYDKVIAVSHNASQQENKFDPN